MKSLSHRILILLIIITGLYAQETTIKLKTTDHTSSFKVTNSNGSPLMTVTGDGRLQNAGIIESKTGGFKFPDGSIQTTAVSSGITYSVGDFAQGGVVFYVDDSGQHGLACAIVDQNGGNGIPWCEVEDGVDFPTTSAVYKGVYAGKLNTALIIASNSQLTDDMPESAATVCVGYSFIQNDIKYGNWYLPTSDELSLMYHNKATINATATANGGSNFANNGYWSSLDFDSGSAIAVSLNYGYPTPWEKDYNMVVRAVRAFLSVVK